jgi:hypothetical protein
VLVTDSSQLHSGGCPLLHTPVSQDGGLEWSGGWFLVCPPTF